ncbi:unnamed protein product [Thelazia callipaeda]|uniref:Carboxypeptidase n=1 Tax=Thelazia callipaeda TaxID=103827 RepID=A0A0N5CVW2_THECL|nr:unnamed protein product [Thelazia callipaeda]
MWWVVVLVLSTSSLNGDEIKQLPGAKQLQIRFKHFSGYFQVSNIHFLHYWFVESQNNVEKDPLIFWFNGGPGCSSLDGLLNEMGPYLVNEDGRTLRNNPFTWNKMASIVYIESPAGVGYSYATNGKIKTTDSQTALENYKAVQAFFEKFPSYRDHAVYIMGESYGGIYVPTLAAHIIRDSSINLKGIAIGNGYVNEVLNIDTSIRFAYGHGLIDEKTWNTLEKDCCHGCIDTCDLTKVTLEFCKNMASIFVEKIFTFLWEGGLNPYDLYRDCDPNSEESKTRINAMKRNFAPTSFAAMYKEGENEINSTYFVPINHYVLGDVPCLNDSALLNYMNDEEVRHALHIPSHLHKWDICSSEVSKNYVRIYNDMAPFVKQIISAGVRVLLYYGDTDMACNFMMGQQFSASLKLPRKQKKEKWMYSKQIAGFKTEYEGLTFLTVRGAGHMAPQWRAPQMQYVIQQFIRNQPI